MKKALSLMVVLAALLAGGIYFSRSVELIEDPLTLDDDYKVRIEKTASQYSGPMRITNNSGIDLKLHMFNAADAVKVVAREDWILKKGESRTYPRASYDFHVFKSQFLDAHIMWTGTRWTDVTFTGNENNLRASGGAKPPVTFANEVDEQLKICVFNARDAVQAIPLNCWTVGKGRTIDWGDAPDTFLLKVFKPAMLDKPLITESDVEHMARITITK